MSSTNNNNFTRGAQLWAHNMRMAIQGAKNICFFGLAVVVVLLVVRLCQYLTLESVYYFLEGVREVIIQAPICVSLD